MAWKTTFNPARNIGIRTLKEVTYRLRERATVTEKDFKAEWLDRLSKAPSLIASGWYAPPPDGITVLAATATDPTRLAYASLRSPEYWPSDRVIDWGNGLLLAYCSPIDKTTGVAGDMAVTMYFGSEARVIDYFRHAQSAVKQVLDSIRIVDSAAEIIERADRIFEQNQLKSYVSSITDPASYNIGHTIPALDPESLVSALSDEQREMCRVQRKFLNRAAAWPIANARQFSIEPQLRSAVDPTFPQLTFHYLVAIDAANVHICRDIDDIMIWSELSESV